MILNESALEEVCAERRGPMSLKSTVPPKLYRRLNAVLCGQGFSREFSVLA